MTQYASLTRFLDEVEQYLDIIAFIEFDAMEEWVETLSNCKAYDSVLDFISYLNEYLEAEIEPEFDHIDQHLDAIRAEMREDDEGDES